MNALSAVALALGLVLAAAAPAQTMQPVAGLAVYDAEGERVGPAIGGSLQFPRVALRIDGLSLVVSMGQGRFDGSEWPKGLAFESPDCTGTPLFPLNTNDEQLLAPTITESETPGIGPADDASLRFLYVPDPAFPVAVYQVRSESDVRGAPRCRSFAAPSPFTGAPARRLLDLGERFPQPVTLRAEPAVDLPALDARVRALEAENAALRGAR